jgi:hypothetical protein
MRDKCFRMSNYCPLKKPYSDTLFVGLLVRSKTLGFGRNGPFDGPSFFETTGDSVVIHSIDTRPLSNGFAFAVHRIKNISRHIVCLLCLCGPLAIRGVVALAGINPINRVLFAWPVAHICDKICVAIFPQPSVTNFNTSSAIPFPSPKCFASASVNHRSVAVVCKFVFFKVSTSSISSIVCTFVSAFNAALTRVAIKQIFITNKRMPTGTLDSVLLADHIGNRQNAFCNHISIISNNRDKMEVCCA